MRLGCTMTCRRDRFPEKNEMKKYLHHEKLTQAQAAMGKVMRYHNPIVAIKNCHSYDIRKQPAELVYYTKTLVSFQSTGATNIGGVNNLDKVGFYVSCKQRGQGTTKKIWGIEQNEARATSLGLYFGQT